jgi:2-oxo-4-hydroxy-4-carboxy-5-ureidoimidazoline decarboxylase
MDALQVTQIGAVNRMSDEDAFAAFKRCCGSTRWAQQMTARRPFAGAAEMLAAGDEIWAELSKDDWLEAFKHHPKIGVDAESLRKKFASTADWSAGEQSGIQSASDEILSALAQGNRDYEKKFGYIFIVCATGKTAREMLEILRSRLPNDPAEEMRIAAGEQSKITRIRLEKLCQEVQSQHTS